MWMLYKVPGGEAVSWASDIPVVPAGMAKKEFPSDAMENATWNPITLDFDSIPETKIIPTEELLRLFTFHEKALCQLAIPVDITVRTFIFQVENYGTIDLADWEALAAINYLESTLIELPDGTSFNILEPGRASLILNA